MKASYLLWAAPLLLAACNQKTENSAVDYTAYVDTHIGTGGHGHVFMGANVPFGMVQLGPTSVPESWDWCSGYHEPSSDSPTPTSRAPASATSSMSQSCLWLAM